MFSARIDASEPSAWAASLRHRWGGHVLGVTAIRAWVGSVRSDEVVGGGPHSCVWGPGVRGEG